MANLHRGEIQALLGGKQLTLCLTLGALAELEAAFGDEDMLALANRFASGRLSARDAIRVLGAGLRGAGHDIADSDVAKLQAEGGAGGFVDTVARLLTATFGAAEAPSDEAERALASGSAKAEAVIPDPFLGRR
ncbi:MAG: gene transfer agent family protein [Hyphomicrobiaceae bacterium]